jgi:hypothetical protein
MDETLQPRMADEFTAFCRLHESTRQVYDWAKSLRKNEWETTCGKLEKIAGVTYSEAVALCKQLEARGFGKFLIGRRGKHSRIAWKFRLTDLAEPSEAQPPKVDETTLEDVSEVIADSGATQPSVTAKMFTIPMAKQRLAETLGISPDSIEIIIKA